MVKKHFFKPLLPGFLNHLTIPTAFFLKCIEGRTEQKMANLRSDASKITWGVKVEDGQKLTDGWKEFALAHDLRIGDIVVFRQEKDMAFHVTLLGPSCCEIQYESCLDENNLGKTPQKKKVKKNPRKETKSSSLDPPFLVWNVAPSTLRYDTLYLPTRFVRENGIETGCGEIILKNEKGSSWTLALRQKLCGTIFITRGWRSFCRANRLEAGDSFTFKLIQGGRTLVLLLSTTESKEEEEGESSEGDQIDSESDQESNPEEIQRKKKVKKDPERETESSSLDLSCFVAKVSPAALRYDTLRLPMSFVRANGLHTRCGEIVLMNEKGRSWTLNLRRKKSCGTMYIRGGWRSFCHANGIKAGDFFTFKLIKRGGTLVLRKSPSPTGSEEEEDCSSEGDDMESLSTESDSDDEEEINQDEKSFEKPRLTGKASSSALNLNQNRFLTLNLTALALERSRLFLPVPFTRMNGINEETKMTLLDKDGVKWSTNVRSEKGYDRKRLVGGWKEFFKANCVKIGDSIMLKLIWEEDRRCVLKFCSKVKQETR
ncbi:unnamed protein product [Microthlaspi erraticum]|uniref:TF-B3 domain-containing protein n=1 Tax=Microthlaspi erraticum TaxID=1685480 RepID=A0A6D2IWS3_9BRAS|nr:unnamed protein product [Microthlaspi erraticum]